MNYKIIHNEQKLDQFIDWLPDLTEEESYYLALVARKKYVEGGNHTPMLRRFCSSKEQMKNRIRQLECPVGAFVDQKSGLSIPQAALALYITPNPRSHKKAFYDSIQNLVAEISKNGWRNPRNIAMTSIARAKSRSCFAHLDVDVENVKYVDIIKEKVELIVGGEASSVIRTKGGCHVLIDPKKVVSEHKNWHPKVIESIGEEFVDQGGDMLCPVVGCTQGNFVPSFV